MQDLTDAATHAAIKQGFDPEFGPEIQAELDSLAPPSFALAPGIRDLRDLLWSSIDNEESRDLDQVEYAEAQPDGSIRILVAIADVDAYVPRGSAIDARAQKNTTSLYTGVVVFPMLPLELSAGLTSLLPDKDRLAVVIELVVEEDGTVERRQAYRALVRNKVKLVYEQVAAWLEQGGQLQAESRLPGLSAQLRLQRDAAKRLKRERQRAGALEFETIEARPVMSDGKVVDLALTPKNRARQLIEDFMIAANVATSKILDGHGSSGIRRVVKEPERWSRIVDLVFKQGGALPPEPDSHALAAFLSMAHARDPLRFPDLSLTIVKLLGRGEYALDLPGRDPGRHFGLAADDYSHATAPNRRYADLIQQRLLKAALAGQPQPYSNKELVLLAENCTVREDAAQKVEREMRKVVAAHLLSEKIGETFEAIVTGASNRGTYVRLLHPPAEGRVIEGEQGMDVGDRVRVRLLATDWRQGFIDFRGLK